MFLPQRGVYLLAAQAQFGVGLAAGDAVEHGFHAVEAFGEGGGVFPLGVDDIGEVREPLPATAWEVLHHVHVVGWAAVLGNRCGHMIEGDPGVRPAIAGGVAKGLGDGSR